MRYRVYAKRKNEVALVYEASPKDDAEYLANKEQVKNPLLHYFVVHHEWFPTMTYEKMKQELNDEILAGSSTL